MACGAVVRVAHEGTIRQACRRARPCVLAARGNCAARVLNCVPADRPGAATGRSSVVRITSSGKEGGMNLNLLQSLIVDEGGQSATEYAILLGWISLSLILT